MEGSGSVWNANSWHWEEKNYNKFASERLTQLLTNAEFAVNDWNFVITEIKSMKAEAQVMIRKGKTILLFEFEFECGFNATNGAESYQGSFKVPEFNQDDLDDLELQVKLPSDATVPKTLLVRHGKKHLKPLLLTFKQNFTELESNREKLAADRQRREEEKARMEQAIQERGNEQQEMLSKLSEEEQKKRQAAWEGREVQQGSVWNANSYFWEEKSVSWASDRLRDLIASTQFSMPSAHITISHIELTGDSSISIRKAKKIISVAYELKLTWDGALLDGSGNQLCQAQGEISFPDVSLESLPDLEAHYRMLTNNPGQDRLDAYIRGQGTRDIIARITEFVEILRNS